MIAFSWPMSDNHGTVRFDNVANRAHGITEILCVIFLVAAAKQRNQLAVKIDLFQRREKVIPVALRFTVVPGRNAQQQDIKRFQIFFCAFCDVMDFCNICTQLFLDHFCNVFGIAGIAAEEDAYECHE